MSDNYNPLSVDVKLAQLIDGQAAQREHLNKQDGVLAEIRAQTYKTNGRVNTLEAEKIALRRYISAFLGLLTVAVLILEYFKK